MLNDSPRGISPSENCDLDCSSEVHVARMGVTSIIFIIYPYGDAFSYVMLMLMPMSCS